MREVMLSRPTSVPSLTLGESSLDASTPGSLFLLVLVLMSHSWTSHFPLFRTLHPLSSDHLIPCGHDHSSVPPLTLLDTSLDGFKHAELSCLVPPLPSVPLSLSLSLSPQIFSSPAAMTIPPTSSLAEYSSLPHPLGSGRPVEGSVAAAAVALLPPDGLLGGQEGGGEGEGEEGGRQGKRQKAVLVMLLPVTAEQARGGVGGPRFRRETLSLVDDVVEQVSFPGCAGITCR